MSANGRNSNGRPDALEDEMAILDGELDAFARETRQAFVRPIAPEVAERHLAAIALEARQTVLTVAPSATRRPTVRRPVARTRWGLVRPVAVAALAALLAITGLVVADVRPPEPVSDALEELGIDVPGSDRETGGDTRNPADDGRAGEAPASGAPDEAPSRAANGNPANDGATPGARHANENASEGQETAAQARSGEVPPDSPGRSAEHPPPASAGPPDDPVPPEQAPQSLPESVPAPGHSSAPPAPNAPAAPPGGGKPG